MELKNAKLHSALDALLYREEWTNNNNISRATAREKNISMSHEFFHCYTIMHWNNICLFVCLFFLVLSPVLIGIYVFFVRFVFYLIVGTRLFSSALNCLKVYLFFWMKCWWLWLSPCVITRHQPLCSNRMVLIELFACRYYSSQLESMSILILLLQNDFQFEYTWIMKVYYYYYYYRVNIDFGCDND